MNDKIKAVTEDGEVIGNITPEPARARQNADYVMLYRRFIQQVSDLGMEDAQALRVLLFLTRHMDTKNALAVPMALISDILKISRQTVSAKIKYLSDNGWISIYKLGRSNVYVVNPDVVWTSYADQKAYCKFESAVMLSMDDNWDVAKKDKTTLKHIDREVLKKLADMELPED